MHDHSRYRPCQRWCARLLLVCFALALPGSPPASAEYSGEQVVNGDVSFHNEGDVATIHASDGAIIYFQELSVRSHEDLHFVQPHSQARVLNKVFGEATHIDGGLFANGIVYIVNPAGVFFGGQAIVDVGGLVAAAGSIDDAHFLKGADVFDLSGPVVNEGSIRAESVALLGTSVANRGSIASQDGYIALVAGDRVVLTRLGGHLYVEVEGEALDPSGAAIEQVGTVDAGRGDVTFVTGDVYSLAINHEGITRGRRLELRADSGTVQVSGLLDASDSREGEQGGDISVTGERVALFGAELDVSGAAGGGRIRVGGDLHGQGDLATARRTWVDADSVLRADASDAGDGGSIVIWSDEATGFLGSLSARGAGSGDGGFAEISGKSTLMARGDVDLGAVHGETGTLLYDPQSIEIVGGAAMDGMDADADPNLLSAGQVLFGDPGDLNGDFVVFESELEGTNANIVLEAEHRIESSGVFDHDSGSGEAVGVVRLQNDNDLTLRTRNDAGDEVGSLEPAGIDLAGVSFQTSGTGSIAISTGDDGLGGGGTGVAADLAVGDLITDGGSVSLTTGAGDIATGVIDTRGADNAAGAGADGGAVTLASVDGAIDVAGVTTSGGDGATDGGAGGAIDLSAGDANSDVGSAITSAGDLVADGGAGGSGIGGAGGSISVVTEGVEVDIGGTTNPTQGGGAIALLDVFSRGGDGADGGNGGGVDVDANDGAVVAGNFDTTGGMGAAAGGNAGSITVETHAGSGGQDKTVDLGALSARGGDGGTGRGGNGGALLVGTPTTPAVVDINDVEIQPLAGGGGIDFRGSDSSGGDGATGGDAGSTAIFSLGSGNIDLGSDAVVARGGAGSAGDGGRGGAIQLRTESGDLSVADVDSRGGDGTNPDLTLFGVGGSAGRVDLSAGSGDGTGGLLLNGLVDTSAGSSDPDATDAALAGVLGGDVTLAGVDFIDRGAQAGPQVRVGGNFLQVEGDAVGMGANGVLEVEGNGDDAARLDILTAGDVNVDVGNAGFGEVVVTAKDSIANVDVRQINPDVAVGDDRILLSGSADTLTIVEVDTVENGTNVAVNLEDADPDPVDPADLDTTLVISSVDSGGVFSATSHGDIVIGDANGTGITMNARPDSGDPAEPTVAGNVFLLADFEGGGSGDGSGAIRNSATGRIDRLGDADSPGFLILKAAEGIGEAANPAEGIGEAAIVMSGGGLLSAANVAEADGDSGIFLQNVDSGDLEVAFFDGSNQGATVAAGTGDISIRNDAGDLIVGGVVSTRRLAPQGEALGGDVSLAVAAGSNIVLGLNVDNNNFALDSGGRQTYDGNVLLDFDKSLNAVGGVEFLGSVDTGPQLGFQEIDRVDRGLILNVGADATFRGDVGANQSLASLRVTTLAPGVGSAVIGTPVIDTVRIVTRDSQSWEVPIELVSDASFESAGSATFGRIDASPGDPTPASATIAATNAIFTDHVGASDAPDRFVVTGNQIDFVGLDSHLVRAGDGGLLLAPGDAPNPPTVANVAKLGGDLRLESSGSVRVANGQKLTVDGRLEIDAPEVGITDVNTRDLDIESADIEVFAREFGFTQLSDGTLALDVGTEIFATTARFSSAPTLVGTGVTPRLVTLSGTAENAGPLQTQQLARPLAASDFVSAQGVALDLAFRATESEPDFEDVTPRLEGPAIEVPRELRVTEQPSAPGAAPESEALVSFLACAGVGERGPLAGCAGTPQAAPGSALDTERASEVSDAFRELLGDTEPVRSARRSLAAAAERGGPLGDPTTPEPGRRYLAQVARVLAQVQMLGIDGESYAEVRRSVLEAVRREIGSASLSVDVLEAAVRSQSAGLRI